MKPMTAWLLVAALIFGLAGCGGPAASQEAAGVPAQTAAAETTGPASDPSDQETAETTLPAPPPEGFLFLTVSRLTFTLAGESEDIYIGTIPRDQVTWGTEDPEVALFEDGVLTAVGPGETTAFAQFGDQRLECTVGCLAETQEDLAQVDPAILRSAKRFPPEAGTEYLSYFDSAAIVGDSITYGMFRWNTLYNELGNILFLCQGGAGIYGFVVDVSYVNYQGQRMTLQDALAASGSDKAFIMLGQNDLSYMTVEETMEKWVLFLDMIREKNPDLKIYLQSCVPEWNELQDDNTKNETIVRHNQELEKFAREQGCQFINLYNYVVDHTGRMPAEYNLDNLIHLNEAGCRMWMQLLRACAQFETLGGELK